MVNYSNLTVCGSCTSLVHFKVLHIFCVLACSIKKPECKTFLCYLSADSSSIYSNPLCAMVAIFQIVLALLI